MGGLGGRCRGSSGRPRAGPSRPAAAAHGRARRGWWPRWAIVGRPRREPAQALGGREGLGDALSRATAACSTASTACCSARPSCTITFCTCAERPRGGAVRAFLPPMKGLSILGSHRIRRHQRAADRGRLPRPLPGGGRSPPAATWSASPSRWPATGPRSSRSRPWPRATRSADSSTCPACAWASARREWSTSPPTPRRASVVASAVGAVGLVPTYRALEAGKDVALANKETLVMAGELMLAQSQAKGGRLLPIDSEHCALHQCLDGRAPRGGAAPRPHRLRRALPQPAPRDLRPHHAGRGPQPPHLEHGPQDHDRLRHPHEQGAGGDRGPLALRRPRRADRGAHPPAVDRALHGRVRGRHGAGPARRHRHAPAHPVRALATPSAGRRPSRGWTSRAPLRLDFDAPDHERFPCLGLAYRALEAGGSAARGPERGQRGGGGGLPRRPHPLPGHPRVDRAR